MFIFVISREDWSDKSRMKRPTKIGGKVTHPTGNNAYKFQGQTSRSHGQ